jgi:hypothetical protein
MEGALATSAALPAPRVPKRPFAINHPWDHNFFLLYVVLIWAAILAGFVPEIVRHYLNGAPPRPWMVRLHGAAFVGWLVLLTTQVLLIRKRKVRLHRRIGVAGAVLAPLMVLLGIGAALTDQSRDLGTPQGDPGGFGGQLIDMIEFGGLVIAAISSRNRPPVHKRLILLATLSIVDAGFARVAADPLFAVLGTGIWQFWVAIFSGSAVLIIGIGVYDWITRRRLLPAYVLGALWIFTGQITASWLYYNAGWKSIATTIIRMW